MRTLKKFIAVLIGFVLSFSFAFIFPLEPVFADEVSFTFPDSWYSSSEYENLKLFYDNLKTNPNYNAIISSKGLTCLYLTGNKCYVQLIPDPIQLSYGSNYIFYNTTFYSAIISSNSPSSASSCSFSTFPNSSNPQCLYYDGSYSLVQARISGSTVTRVTTLHAYQAIFSTGFGFVPSPSVLYGLDLDINETDFYNWIIDNNKLAELPNYITTNKLMSFIQFYKKFGGSFTNFLKNIPDWFRYMNIVNQSADNVNVLKSSMDKLFQEYINSYWYAIYPDFSNIPTHRRNIRTNTTDTDTTLITDDTNDTVDTSILRDILRGIISINNSISDGFIAVINKLTGLDFTVNVANNGGSNDSDNSLSIDYSDQGNFGIDEIHQYEPLPEAPDIDGDVDFLEYPAVLAQTSTHFFNLLPNDMSALMSAVLVLGVLINKLGR